MATLLKNILKVAFSARIYVNQLERESEMIQEINQAFLDRSISLKLMSFYESMRETRMGINLEVNHLFNIS